MFEKFDLSNRLKRMVPYFTNTTGLKEKFELLCLSTEKRFFLEVSF